MRYILTHDLGTTSDKACVFDEKLNLVASKLEGYQTFYPRDGKAVQRPEDWWRVFCDTTKELLRENDISPDEILAIACSGHSPSMVPLGKDGQLLLAEIPIYADLTARKQVENLLSNITAEEFYNITGAGQVPEQYSLFKMMAFRDEKPFEFRKTAKILNTVDYLVYRLTGEIKTDYSQACNTGALDIRERIWSRKILQAAGIPEEIMPELSEASSIVAGLTGEASIQTGLRKGIPVVTGGGDVACAAAGAGTVKEGVSYICLGSAAWMGFFSKNPVLDYHSKLVNYCHIVPDSYALQYQMTGAGICYQWLRDSIYRYGKSEEYGEIHSDEFEAMNNEALSSIPGAHKLIFLPFMRGIWAGETNPDARGVLFGLNLTNNVGDIYRAAIEGMGFGLKEIMDTFSGQGYDSNQVRAIGGCAKSRLWRQIIADISGKEVLCPSIIQEAGSFGVAVAAGVGIGLLGNFNDLDHIIEISDISYPDRERHEKYGEYYEVFLQIKRDLSEAFVKLASIG